MPDLPEQARKISESQARRKLVELFFLSVGAAQQSAVGKLFAWGNEITGRAISKLIESETLVKASHPQKTGEWLVLPELIT